MSNETFDPVFKGKSQAQGTMSDEKVGQVLSLGGGALNQQSSTPGELARGDEPNRSDALQDINDAPGEDLADPEVQLDVYAREIGGLIREGKGYKGFCPFHNDHQPSFRIDLKNGKWVWFCHPCAALEGGPVGGNAYELLKRLGKPPKPGNGEKKKGDPTATYHYTDSDGKLLFQVLRYGEGKGKTFKQRRPDGNGGWEWNVPEDLRTLYNLPAITNAEQVLIVEGEKDADTARKLGFVATSNPGGATKWLPKYSELLAGKDVIIIPDADAAGDKHRKVVLTSLCESAEHPKSIKVIKLPAGKDLTEWAQDGGDAKQLTDLAEKAERFAYVDADSGEFVFGKIEDPKPDYGIVVVCKSDFHGVEYRKFGFEVLAWDKNDEERLAKELAGKNVVLTFQNEAVVALLQPEAQSLKVVANPPESAEHFLELVEKAPERRIRLVVSNADDFLKKEIKPREVLMQTTKAEVPIFYAQSINQIFAWRGLGKTYLALGIVSGLVQGGKFLSWSAKRPVKVLYVEGEIPEYQMQERLRQVVGPSDGNLRIITLDEQPENEIPSLSTPYGRKLVEEAIGDAEVLVLDSISTLFNFATNEEEPWLDVMAWLKKLRSKGLCIIFLHHAGKSGLQRGSSKSEDLLDVSIKLERPSGYRLDEGLRVNLRFDKTRGVAMVDGEVEVTMTIDNGRAEFLYGAIKKEDKRNSEEYDTAKEYLRKYPDASLRDLEKMSGVPKSTMANYKKEWLAEEGVAENGPAEEKNEYGPTEPQDFPGGKQKRPPSSARGETEASVKGAKKRA
jgi:5S rRNA maturation endonuclease (ribonuclease M5)/archaellum biogenesis ATPase FlaH